jgi:hypothetical protein
MRPVEREEAPLFARRMYQKALGVPWNLSAGPQGDCSIERVIGNAAQERARGLDTD